MHYSNFIAYAEDVRESSKNWTNIFNDLLRHGQNRELALAQHLELHNAKIALNGQLVFKKKVPEDGNVDEKELCLLLRTKRHALLIIYFFCRSYGIDWHVPTFLNDLCEFLVRTEASTDCYHPSKDPRAFLMNQEVSDDA